MPPLLPLYSSGDDAGGRGGAEGRAYAAAALSDAGAVRQVRFAPFASRHSSQRASLLSRARRLVSVRALGVVTYVVLLALLAVNVLARRPAPGGPRPRRSLGVRGCLLICACTEMLVTMYNHPGFPGCCTLHKHEECAGAHSTASATVLLIS